MSSEIDLRPGIRSATFQHLNFAFAKLCVKDIEAHLDAVSRRFPLGWNSWIGKPI